jgi:hypothetical protein
MTPPDANEKLTRRILGGLGVRPVGHQDPNAADPGQVATAPAVPAQHGNRLPPWWEAKKPVTGVGDDAPIAATGGSAAPVPPKPAAPPRDWLDDIIDSNKPAPAPARKPAAEPEDEPAEDDEEQVDRPRTFEPQPDYWPRPHLPATLTHIPDRAEAAISHGTRRFLYNATAAGAGWGLGLYGQFADVLADCGATSIGGGLVLGIGSTLLIAHVWDRRTRHWWPGIAWIARIPLATAVLTLALWAPAAT